MSKYIKFRNHYFRKDEITELSLLKQEGRVKWIITLSYIEPHINHFGLFTARKQVDFGYDSTINDIDKELLKDIHYIRKHCDHCVFDIESNNMIRQLNRE
jgi:hypothetical protein